MAGLVELMVVPTEIVANHLRDSMVHQGGALLLMILMMVMAMVDDAESDDVVAGDADDSDG